MIMGGDFSVMDYMVWNEIPTALVTGGRPGLHRPHALHHPRTHRAQAQRLLIEWPKAPVAHSRPGLSCRSKMPSQLVISPASIRMPDASRSTVTFTAPAFPPTRSSPAAGIAIALADGISSSEVSHIASETAVASSDYFCTSDARR